MNNQTQILLQGAYTLGVSIQGLQAFFLGCLEFSVRAPLRISAHKHTGTHSRTQNAHLCTRVHTLQQATRPAPLCSPPSMRRPAHARTTCTRTHARTTCTRTHCPPSPPPPRSLTLGVCAVVPAADRQQLRESRIAGPAVVAPTAPEAAWLLPADFLSAHRAGPVPVAPGSGLASLDCHSLSSNYCGAGPDGRGEGRRSAGGAWARHRWETIIKLLGNIPSPGSVAETWTRWPETRPRSSVRRCGPVPRG